MNALCTRQSFTNYARQKQDETYISWSHDTANLLHRVQIGAQTSVHREDLLVDDRSDGQTVEAVGERLPQLDIVPPLAFIVKTVDTVDGCAFVVTAENEKVLRVLNFVCQQQADGLKRLLATVDVIAEE
jgi:hypothetical protein